MRKLDIIPQLFSKDDHIKQIEVIECTNSDVSEKQASVDDFKENSISKAQN